MGSDIIFQIIVLALVIFILFILFRYFGRIILIITGILIISIFFVIAINFPELQNTLTIISLGFSIILVIITAFYAGETRRLADLAQKQMEISARQINFIEKDRRGRIIIGWINDIFSSIRGLSIYKYRQALENGDIIKWGFDYQKSHPGEKVKVFLNPPKSYLNQRIHSPDEILRKYLDQVEELCNEYDAFSNQIEASITKINEKRLIIWQEFSNFFRSMWKSNPVIGPVIPEADIENAFAWILAGAKLKPSFKHYDFVIEKKDILRSKLIEKSFKEDMEEFNKIRTSFIEMLIKFDKILSDLESDWMREYDITNSMLASQPAFV